MNDSIKKLLRITDKNLEIVDVSYETVNKKSALSDQRKVVLQSFIAPHFTL
ncbi:hypothetical protein ACIMQZ_002774 [Enterococcus faecalis]